MGLAGDMQERAEHAGGTVCCCCCANVCDANAQERQGGRPHTCLHLVRLARLPGRAQKAQSNLAMANFFAQSYAS
eukprot:1152733-Pelagomonas_calceolata.AAC.2